VCSGFSRKRPCHVHSRLGHSGPRIGLDRVRGRAIPESCLPPDEAHYVAMAFIAADEERFTETPLVRRLYRCSSCVYETLTRGYELPEGSRCSRSSAIRAATALGAPSAGVAGSSPASSSEPGGRPRAGVDARQCKSDANPRDATHPDRTDDGSDPGLEPAGQHECTPPTPTGRDDGRRTLNPRVQGSSPWGRTTSPACSRTVRQPAATRTLDLQTKCKPAGRGRQDNTGLGHHS
jgi:hypothetical protein